MGDRSNKGNYLETKMASLSLLNLLLLILPFAHEYFFRADACIIISMFRLFIIRNDPEDPIINYISVSVA